jgi:flagellar motor protein MotB
MGSGLGDFDADMGGWCGPSPEELAQQEEEAFLQTCWAPVDDFVTPTGGVFDVRLEGTDLLVTLKVSYDFQPGDPANAPVGVSRAELNWTQDEKDLFKMDFASTVTGTWSLAHRIRSTRAFWTTEIDVLIDVVEDDADPHFKIKVHKYPPDAGDGPASVCDSGYHHAGGGMCDPNAPGDESGTTVLDSRDTSQTRVRNGGQPVVGVWFEQSESDLDATDVAALAPPAADLVAHPDWNVELSGRASAEGGARSNLQLARDRTESVADELTRNGASDDQIIRENAGEQGAARNDPNDRRVDVHVLDVQTQVTANHEAGHMFGLADEYLGAGEAPNTPLDPAYRQFIADNAEVPSGGLPNKGPSDNIMSNGMDIQNWHYAPFVAGLKQVTGSDDWTV